MYVTIAEADEYFEFHMSHDLWDALSDTVKKQALTTATRKIDVQRWIGKKKDPDQDLEFPRNIDDELHVRVKQACCEEALFLLKGGGQDAERGVQSVKAGDASETYHEHLILNAFSYSLSPIAKKMLFRWLKRTMTIC